MPTWSGFFGLPAPQGPQYGPLPADTQDSSMTPETDYWSQPSVGGMPLHRFATMTGLLANAISPNSIGGRMGQAAAGMAGNYGDVALHGEQQMRQQMKMAAAKAEQERQRQQALRGFFGSRQPTQSGGFGVRERQPQAPGAQPSMFGVPPVTTNLEGFGAAPSPTSQYDPAAIAELSGLMNDPEGFKAVMAQLKYGGQLPNTQESYETNRNMALANSPAVGGLVPNRMTNVTIDKGVPTMKFGQPSSPGEVEAQAITEQGGGPGARLQALRSQSETPVTLANNLNEMQQRIQSRRMELFGGVNSSGMRIPGLSTIPTDDMIGLINMAESAEGVNERLSGARGQTQTPLFGDLLPNDAMIRQINQGLLQRLRRQPSRDEIVREWAKILIGRRNRQQPSLAPVQE